MNTLQTRDEGIRLAKRVAADKNCSRYCSGSPVTGPLASSLIVLIT